MQALCSTAVFSYKRFCTVLFRNTFVHLIKKFYFFQTSRTVKTDMTLTQSLELGNLSIACITIPESCGTQGGTVGVWVKVIDCQHQGGIITSLHYPQTSFSILCTSSTLQ